MIRYHNINLQIKIILKMKDGNKYIRQFIWGSILYWFTIRLIHLDTIVNGFYFIGQFTWGYIINLRIKNARLDEYVEKHLRDSLWGSGIIILAIIVLIFELYERFVLDIPTYREPYDWESRFNV